MITDNLKVNLDFLDEDSDKECETTGSDNKNNNCTSDSSSQNPEVNEIQDNSQSLFSADYLSIFSQDVPLLSAPAKMNSYQSGQNLAVNHLLNSRSSSSKESGQTEPQIQFKGLDFKPQPKLIEKQVSQKSE